MKISPPAQLSNAYLHLIFFLALLFAACASVDAPGHQARRFLERLNSYPATDQPLALRKLTGTSFTLVPDIPESPDVFIIVHPAYSLFFRDGGRSRSLAGAKYSLLAKEFDIEARFIAEASRTGKIVILIIPGNYGTDSIAPLSYTSYLNRTAGEGSGVFYLYSASSSSGTISMNEMVDLYRFLQGARASRILVGGGYIGRCQGEFYAELTTYYEKAAAFIVPEISTISPDDISEAEAETILERIQQQDFSPVREFMDRKLDKRANLLSLPRKKEL